MLLRVFLRAAQPMLASAQSWLCTGVLDADSASQEFFICCGVRCASLQRPLNVRLPLV